MGDADADLSTALRKFAELAQDGNSLVEEHALHERVMASFRPLGLRSLYGILQNAFWSLAVNSGF